MKTKHFIAITGLLALMANFLVPGLAFATSQTVGQTISCPGAPEFTFEIADTPDSIIMDSLAFKLISTQDSYESLNGNDTPLAAAKLLKITDTRSGLSADCPLANKGFYITAEITTTLISSESHTIADSNFRIITSNELAVKPPTGYEAWADGKEVWYDDPEAVTGNLYNVDAPFVYDDVGRLDATVFDDFNYADAYKKACTGGDTESSCTGGAFTNTLDAARTILSTSTSHMTTMATGVVVYASIPSSQEPGTYNGTLTYTLYSV